MNTNIVYPTLFEQKVLTLEGTNGKPVEINLIAPSLIKPNVPFELKVAVYDENGFLADYCDENLSIKCEQNELLSFDVPLYKGKPAVAKIENIVLENEGLYRFTAKLGDKLFYSNPSYCSNSNKEQIYWGDPHIHTNIGNCVIRLCRSLNFCFVGARLCAGLDWASSADHVSNGRGEYAKWREQVAVANQFNEPPEFVTLPAYEASLSGGDGGDNNIYMTDFPDMYVDEYGVGNLKTLVENLGDKLDKKNYFAVPPFADAAKCAEQIGGEYVLSYRPNPASTVSCNFNPAQIKNDLTRDLGIFKVNGCHPDITLKDIETVENDPGRVREWVRITRETIAEVW